jgi:hypothetical protein
LHCTVEKINQPKNYLGGINWKQRSRLISQSSWFGMPIRGRLEEPPKVLILSLQPQNTVLNFFKAHPYHFLHTTHFALTYISCG